MILAALVALTIIVLADGLTWRTVSAVALLVATGVLVYRDARERRRIADELSEVHERLAETAARTERRADASARLADFSHLLQTCQLPDEALRIIERTMPGLLHRAGAVFLVNEGSGQLDKQAHWGDPTRLESTYAPGSLTVLAERGVREAAAAVLATTPARAMVVGSDDRRLSCMPLVAQGESIGVAVFLSPLDEAYADGIGPDAVDRAGLTAAACEQMALALASLRLRETLRTQSIRDPLTGLFNRRFLIESLERECRRSVRAGRPLSVLMIDIDNFKIFNDTFGHEAGDVVLREVGTMLRTFFRGEDVACRYGGEEFALVLSDTTAEGAIARASDLRIRVNQLRPTLGRKTLGAVSISVGVAALPEQASDAEGLLRIADRALYRAKREGRDRVVSADARELAEGVGTETGLS